MHLDAELCAVLGNLTPVSVVDTFTRRVPLADLLGITGSITPGAELQIISPTFLLTTTSPYRYTRAGIAALYLGEGEDAAAAEVKQHPGLSGFARKPTSPDSVYHVEANLSAVLDLTTETMHATLGTSLEELIAPWRLMSPAAPTQQLGAAAYSHGGFEAIRYPCAPLHSAGSVGACLVIFRDRVRPKSTVRIFDPKGLWREAWP